MTVIVRKGFEEIDNVKLDTGPGKTEQAHKNECDMNFILRDYTRTGFIRHAKNNQGRYDDVSVSSFQDAMFLVTQAKNMFNELPSQVRKRFGNDPSEFLGFVQNPENKEEMAKLGILKGNDGVDLSGVPTKAPVQGAEPSNTPLENPVASPAPGVE